MEKYISMDTVLLIFGVLGLGAMVIAAYVFTVSARNYVSEDDLGEPPTTSTAYKPSAKRVPRSDFDRRKQNMNSFPMTVNGVLIADDRRVFPERRFAA